MAVQCYFLSPNKDAPNSRLPVLHYRDVLPEPRDEASVTDFLTRNRWEKRHRAHGDTLASAIFTRIATNAMGHSKMLLGKISTGQGMEVDVKTGDVIILPAGTAHSSLASSSDYRYIGVYPQDCPKWRNEMGKTPAGEFKTVIKSVEMPEEDPVYGRNGPLNQLWNEDILAKL
ncbi:unnamed protein product [Colletotrichum noveboracense]|uniref:Cupin type-1 domain-containing protein n=1 Tax=Colletotrichum noveboracense TaxID=2664923 RepID=A0A9W4S5G8_9PEZI|nr:unnamed protein product [Colletotrichum noveboracense]